MKIYDENIQKVKRIKNKVALEDDILFRLSAILKRQPSLYFNKKLSRLKKIEEYLNEKSRKISKALDGLEILKTKVIKQIEGIEIKNSEIKNDLMKKLTETKMKGKSNREITRK